MTVRMALSSIVPGGSAIADELEGVDRLDDLDFADVATRLRMLENSYSHARAYSSNTADESQ